MPQGALLRPAQGRLTLIGTSLTRSAARLLSRSRAHASSIQLPGARASTCPAVQFQAPTRVGGRAPRTWKQLAISRSNPDNAPPSSPPRPPPVPTPNTSDGAPAPPGLPPTRPETPTALPITEVAARGIHPVPAPASTCSANALHRRPPPTSTGAFHSSSAAASPGTPRGVPPPWPRPGSSVLTRTHRTAPPGSPVPTRTPHPAPRCPCPAPGSPPPRPTPAAPTPPARAPKPLPRPPFPHWSDRLPTSLTCPCPVANFAESALLSSASVGRP